MGFRRPKFWSWTGRWPVGTQRLSRATFVVSHACFVAVIDYVHHWSPLILLRKTHSYPLDQIDNAD